MDEDRSQVLEFRIPADVRFVSIVRRGVRSLAESVGFPSKDAADVEVAVAEAVTNSVRHGSGNVDDPAVTVRCRAFDEYMVVEIEDFSSAERIPGPTDHCDPNLDHGRGILMMRTLMDECEDSRTDSGIRVRMAKQRTTIGH